MKKFKRNLKKAAAIGAMAVVAIGAAAPSNKAEAKWFGSDYACDGGSAHTVYYFFGVPIQTGGDVPNSELCK
jgi:hypothetical protein